jgi:hypothetical protein
MQITVASENSEKSLRRAKLRAFPRLLRREREKKLNNKKTDNGNQCNMSLWLGEREEFVLLISSGAGAGIYMNIAFALNMKVEGDGKQAPGHGDNTTEAEASPSSGMMYYQRRGEERLDRKYFIFHEMNLI